MFQEQHSEENTQVCIEIEQLQSSVSTVCLGFFGGFFCAFFVSVCLLL